MKIVEATHAIGKCVCFHFFFRRLFQLIAQMKRYTEREKFIAKDVVCRIRCALRDLIKDVKRTTAEMIVVYLLFDNVNVRKQVDQEGEKKRSTRKAEAKKNWKYYLGQVMFTTF